MDNRVTVGRRGEDLAAAHVVGLGWRILDRNWRCRSGELDLVALDPGGSGRGTVVFCEVKCRTGTQFGHPLEAITPAKLARLKDLAGLWLQAHAQHPDSIRLDAIGVLLQGAGSRVTHARGVTA